MEYGATYVRLSFHFIHFCGVVKISVYFTAAFKKPKVSANR